MTGFLTHIFDTSENGGVSLFLLTLALMVLVGHLFSCIRDVLQTRKRG
jgi:hypothetical protein